MFRQPGFLSILQNQLEKISYQEIQSIDKDNGLRLQSLVRMLINPQDYSVINPEPLGSNEVSKYGEIDDDLFNIGLDAIENGEVAYCVLAGGDDLIEGVPQCLARLPHLGLSLLAAKLIQSVPSKNVWIMTSPMNDHIVKEVLASYVFKGEVKTFQQYQSVRLTPDNCLHYENSEPSFYPCGHGDVIPALRESGLLNDFLKQGGKYIYVVNVNNALASLDPGVVGYHIKNNKPITCEVVEKEPTDSGGILCNVDGANQVVEQFRILDKCDSGEFKWLSTNSMVINANLDFDTMKWSWHRIKKNLNGKLVVQYERLLQDLTYTFQTSFLEVPRELRFFPVRNSEDLTPISETLNGN